MIVNFTNPVACVSLLTIHSLSTQLFILLEGLNGSSLTTVSGLSGDI